MCGIFGVFTKEGVGLSPRQIESIFCNLAKLSESRGKEAAGLALDVGGEITIHKQPVSASVMLRSKEFQRVIAKITQLATGSDRQISKPLALIGHSRLVTNGAQETHENNQPVIASDIVAVHNGIITNDDALWEAFPYVTQCFQIDTEILLRLIRHFHEEKQSLACAFRSAYALIEGTASVASLFSKIDIAVLATNNGSLYVCSAQSGKLLIFASEEYILRQLANMRFFRRSIGAIEISHIRPEMAYAISLSDLTVEEFSLSGDEEPNIHAAERNQLKRIIDIPPDSVPSSPSLGIGRLTGSFAIPEHVSEKIEASINQIVSLTRCTRCILPETMPFINFDKDGVCNYCRNHNPLALQGREILEEVAARYRRLDGKPDCILAFSGGRDSSYALHFFVRELKMNPIAYTYDWGMVTDLARRNVSRMCAKLGIEHILVSADINKKRLNIQKNIYAWLKRPELGMVPLFMAGDKQYFLHANTLRKQLGLDLVVFAYNPFEKTHFKTGFASIYEGEGKVFDIPVISKIKLAIYYGMQFVRNPAYLNRSLGDSLHAFYVSYLGRRDYLRLFEYIQWDEGEISSTLNAEYNWEEAQDTKGTWRIGDGTAAFYNYIYYIGAGFTENDTFISHQIRAGQIDREEGLKRAGEENKPRWKSIKWYCDIVDVDFHCVVQTIAEMPRRYPMH